ncbi:MAG: phosphodiesterase [Mesorhizobium sp.]|nr:phosphodiesterase [Mesorhizobium sp.]
MKLVHISDIHINADPIGGADTIAAFAACLAHVEKRHGDADAVVITGDLTHHGQRHSYVRLREMLDAWPTKPFLMIGNHDHRDTFREIFPEVEADVNGYIQYVRDVAGHRLVFLDTNLVGNHSGRLGPRRQAWLAARLSEAARDGLPVLLFLHHNPLPIGVLATDILALVQRKEFAAILRAHRDTVRHIFFGHCHMSLSGSLEGIPFSAPRSTSHPGWPEFEGRLAYGHGSIEPSYNLALIDNDNIVVHTIEYRLDDRIEWEPLTGGGTGSVTVPPGA